MSASSTPVRIILPPTAPPAAPAPSAAALPAGVYLREGHLTLPNTLCIAYQMWTNRVELVTPVEKRERGDKAGVHNDASDVASAASATSGSASASAPTPAPPRLNLLALHDKFDTSSSFDVLAPSLLSSLLRSPHAAHTICLLVLDLVGHGTSSWRPRDGNYAPVHTISDVEFLLSHRVLGWKEVVLVGHGRGAILAAMLAGAHAAKLPAGMAHTKDVSQLQPPLPLPLGCVLLDPFEYEAWRLPAGALDEAYDSISYHQSEADNLMQALEDRRRWQRERKTLYPTVEQAVSSHLSSHPTLDPSSARILLSRGLKLIKRPKQPPPAEVLASLQGALADERELILPAGTTTPQPGRDYDPSTEEVGYVSRHDPLLHARTLLDFSRSQIRAFMNALRCPTLMLHAATTQSIHDGPFQRHVQWMVGVGGEEEGEEGKGSIFNLHVGKGTGTIKDIAGEHYFHLDPDTALEDVLPAVAEFVRDAWNDRENTRREAREHVQRVVGHTRKARREAKQREVGFTPPKEPQALSKL